ncbi:hypothetical protein JOB18_041369 [Solea senegalensis]|uniref:Uncharacterized protein n=1 Tax=Solea senegalensis TaxID=28829 RepID=A0AAV6PZH4_SOLSE|nr:hypothetical protein JOB18_041369 [Solea senegalensis]
MAHIGTNDLAWGASELSLLDFLHTCGKSVFISRPIPAFGGDTSPDCFRLYMKTSVTVHLHAYTAHLSNYKDAHNAANHDCSSNHDSQLIHSCSNNPKTLFSTANKLLKPCNNILTSITADKCNPFLAFFNQRSKPFILSNPRSSQSLHRSPPPPPLNHCHTSPLSPPWNSSPSSPT